MSDFNQAKYIQKYQKEKYDRCIFNVPKGEKSKIIKHYEKAGYESMNQYINALIKQDMNGGVLNRWENRAGVSIFLRIAKEHVNPARYACQDLLRTTQGARPLSTPQSFWQLLQADAGAKDGATGRPQSSGWGASHQVTQRMDKGRAAAPASWYSTSNLTQGRSASGQD